MDRAIRVWKTVHVALSPWTPIWNSNCCPVPTTVEEVVAEELELEFEFAELLEFELFELFMLLELVLVLVGKVGARLGPISSDILARIARPVLLCCMRVRPADISSKIICMAVKTANSRNTAIVMASSISISVKPLRRTCFLMATTLHWSARSGFARPVYWRCRGSLGRAPSETNSFENLHRRMTSCGSR